LSPSPTPATFWPHLALPLFQECLHLHLPAFYFDLLPSSSLSPSPTQLLFDRILPYHYPKNIYIALILTYLLSTLIRSSNHSMWPFFYYHFSSDSIISPATSVWKSSYKTGKRPGLDRTKTEKDRKISGPVKTATAVRSSVHPNLEMARTDEKPVKTGLNRSFGP